MNYLDNFRLTKLLSRLRSSGYQMENLEVTKAAGIYFANVFDKTSGSIIGTDVFSGASHSEAIAISKAIVESIEAKAFHDGRLAGLKACQTEKSEGFAGYPTTYLPQWIATKRCRENALAEAIERYAWATWWDNPEISFRHHDIKDLGNISTDVLGLLSGLKCHSAIRQIHVVQPMIRSEISLWILLAEFENGGFTTGGAAGPNNESGLLSSTLRAAAELTRHVLALSKLAPLPDSHMSGYEAKLAYFGFGKGTELVKRRLEAAGSHQVVLPRLAFDEEIPHDYAGDVIVHRCLFDNQPPFVSGPVNRLCI